MVTPLIDSTKEMYNKFTELPNLSYNIVSYLMDNNELLFKLLKYATADAWKSSKANLTKAEKGALIYDGIKVETDCNIFLDIGQSDSWTKETSILRISPLEVIPTNYIYGYVSIAFEIFTHYKLSTLSNYQTRTDLIVQQLIATLNGAEIGGLGRLYFDAKASSKCRAYSIGQIPYKGKLLVMCNHLA